MKTLRMFAAVAVAVAFTACEKDTGHDGELQEETAASEEVAMNLAIDEELDKMLEMSLEGDFSKKSSLSSCLTYSLDTSGPGTLITLDFGTTNCQGADGAYRRGQILISFSDKPFQPGAVRSIIFKGYAVNDFEINGAKSVTFKGLNASNQPYAEISSGLNIMHPDSSTATWSSNRTRTWVQGFRNFEPFDDAFEVMGSASGTTASGISYNLSITSPLRVESTCHNIVSGSIDISSPAFDTRNLDYGKGSCDNVASISVNGKSKQIILK